MSNSTRPKASDKAAVLKAARKYKAKNKVPLLAHATMRWGRKINGRLFYYGPVDGNLPDFGASAAIEEYHRVVEDDRAGRARRLKDSDLMTLQQSVNVFLTAKAALRDSGELAARTWSNYHQTCGRILDVLGKHRAVADLQPEDFRSLRAALGKGRGVVSLQAEVTRSRVFFKFCDTEGLVDRPVRYGTGFDLPSPKAIRQARAARGTRMFEAPELRKLLDHAEPVLKAWILLAANCGFGQSDLASLPKAALDLEGGWAVFPRPKTGVARRCPLWPETVAAVKAAIAVRPDPKDPADNDLVFVTKTGLRLVRDMPTRTKDKEGDGLTTHLDAVGPAFAALMKTCELNGSRNFYSLRHTFLTVGEHTGDFPAVGKIMGHTDSSMAARYREHIDDSRLQAVVDHVHTWLFGSEETE